MSEMCHLPSIYKEREGAQVAVEDCFDGVIQAVFPQDLAHQLVRRPVRSPVSFENTIWDVSGGVFIFGEKVTAMLGLGIDELAKY